MSRSNKRKDSENVFSRSLIIEVRKLIYFLDGSELDVVLDLINFRFVIFIVSSFFK